MGYGYELDFNIEYGDMATGNVQQRRNIKFECDSGTVASFACLSCLAYGISRLTSCGSATIFF